MEDFSWPFFFISCAFALSTVRLLLYFINKINKRLEKNINSEKQKFFDIVGKLPNGEYIIKELEKSDQKIILTLFNNEKYYFNDWESVANFLKILKYSLHEEIVESVIGTESLLNQLGIKTEEDDGNI